IVPIIGYSEHYYLPEKREADQPQVHTHQKTIDRIETKVAATPNTSINARSKAEQAEEGSYSRQP
ncbi:hypothetical protein WG66_002764, partial [Moniliophthora roreri]